MDIAAGELKDKKAIFITLEGIEGSGKSSLLNFLNKFFRKKKLSVKIFRDPGSTNLGEKIRKFLLDKKSRVSVYAELFLYLAARAQLIEEKLYKALKSYDVVICDRFYDSTIAYQGYGLELGKIAETLSLKFSFGIVPDLTIILDTDVKRGLSRIKNKDRIERRPLSFHLKVKEGYKKLAKRFPSRIRLIEEDNLEEIFKKTEKIAEKLLRRWKKNY